VVARKKSNEKTMVEEDGRGVNNNKRTEILVMFLFALGVIV